jgi:hypothetical protein
MTGTDKATKAAARREAWNRRASATAATPIVRSPLEYLETQVRKTKAATNSDRPRHKTERS